MTGMTRLIEAAKKGWPQHEFWTYPRVHFQSRIQKRKSSGTCKDA